MRFLHLFGSLAQMHAVYELSLHLPAPAGGHVTLSPELPQPFDSRTMR